MMAPSNPRIPFALSSQRRRLPPLRGKRLIVNVAMNIEHWPFDRPMPRTVLPPPHGQTAGPDIPNFSWVEYGLRCGVPRILDMMNARGIVGSALMNASVADVYPACAEAFVAAGWEIVGHGYIQRALSQEEDEAAVIEKSLERLSRLASKRVRGWLGPGLAETLDTPDHLKRLGVDYVHDWVLDDLPCWMRTKYGPLMALPYTVELNDVPIYAIEKLSSDELLKRVEATLDQLEKELRTQPRVMTIALHPHLIGAPHRAIMFARVLDCLLGHSEAIFVTSEHIADWYSAAEPAGEDVV